MREKRRRFSKVKQRQASYQLCLRLSKQPEFSRAKHIAFYWPCDGEISLLPLLQMALNQKKSCYLPVIDSGFNMYFCLYKKNTKLVNNRYGIKEPYLKRKVLRPEHLDLIFVPLVAFDEQGKRLGMGGGYYDRAFSYKKKNAFMSPTLIGVAFDYQKITRLPEEAWDIPMAKIISNSRSYSNSRTDAKALIL